MDEHPGGVGELQGREGGEEVGGLISRLIAAPKKAGEGGREGGKFQIGLVGWSVGCWMQVSRAFECKTHKGATDRRGSRDPHLHHARLGLEEGEAEEPAGGGGEARQEEGAGVEGLLIIFWLGGGLWWGQGGR